MMALARIVREHMRSPHAERPPVQTPEAFKINGAATRI